MNAIELHNEQQRLRQQLLTQRRVVEQAIGDVYTPLPEPRSKTMRFLQKNSLVASLVGKTLKFVIASRLIR